MRKTFTFIAAICALMSGAALLQLKLAVQDQAERVAALAEQIHEDEESLRILRAEFAHLTTPRSLQEQSIENLAIMPPRPEQVLGNIDEIPFRRGDSKVDGSQSVLLPTAEEPKANKRQAKTAKSEDQTL